jgi:3-hydroxyisobutyrate dehydrogenase
MTVAFLGLGTMGLRMARRLVAAGHEVVACDVDRDRAASLGARTATTPAAAVSGAEVAITSLPSPAAVEAVVRELGAAAAPGTTVIEMSTSPPRLERVLAAELEARGVEFLDAPVSGGPDGAEAGTLAIMVGGRQDVLARRRGLLEALGTRISHVGPAGAGQVVKLCNNLIAASEMVALAEACAMLEHEGIDAATAYTLLTSSTSDSAVMRRRFPIGGVRPEHPASAGYAPMFTLDLLAKDLLLALELADETGVDAPLARSALAVYERAQRAGLGGLDYSAVYRAVRP